MTHTLPKHAAICALETGVEVTQDGEMVHVSPGVLGLSPYQARLLANALMEAATQASGSYFLILEPNEERVFVRPPEDGASPGE